MIKISRLKKNQLNKNNQLIKINRLRRLIIAEWTQINMSDPDLVQIITDTMINNYPVQINYEGSGWRTIQPYGWNTSKKNENLLMCYKDTGEVRSYRFDRISDLYVDYDNQVSITNNPEMNNDQETQIYENIMNDQNEEIDMPILPEDNTQNTDQRGIYDEELNMLSNNLSDENILLNNTLDNNLDNNIQNNEIENINEINNNKEQIEDTLINDEEENKNE
jgi:predicted DNA-binding transcriptional regulator YafY